MSQSISPLKEQKFKLLQAEGKQLAAEGKLEESLQKFELAKIICPTPKVLQRIEKLKECLKVDKSNVHNGNNLPPSHMSKDLSSKELQKVYPNLKSTDQSVFVLNSIQNVQKSNTPRITSPIDLDPVFRSRFKELKKIAKELAFDGNYEEALKHFKEALTICDCPYVKRYIEEIQLVMSDNYGESKEAEVQSEPGTIREPPNFVQVSAQENTSLVHSLESNKFDFENKLAEVKLLYEEARELAADGRLANSLKVLKKAQLIHKTEKVQKKIDKLKELISDDLNDPESDEMIKITDDFSVFHDIYKKLYSYQREGVAWMWKLYKMGKGGVLGDDMGLGKTFQAIAFLSGMIDADLVKHVLIIMPVSLIQNWKKEFKKWCPGIVVHDFHGCSKKERERNLLRVQRRGHILLTSYGMVVNNVESLIEMDERKFVWDYVILDEGHKIKNPTKTTKAVYEIPSKNRLVLTGTPIQNNLKELWSLYDFVQQGTLLGSLKTFKMQYENPITRSREKDATAGEKRLGNEIAENLKSLIKPYFLRRTKDEIWGSNNNKDMEQLEDQMNKMTISKLNVKKNDLILWTYMSETQIEIYKSFLHSEAVKSILVSKRSPLVELTTLKKICDHPRLLSQRACFQLGLNGDLQKENVCELDDESTMASSIDNVSDETLLYESGKLKLVLQLLENLRDAGHRTLIFSLSRKILDMIHRILVNRNWKVMRLDGTISKTEERERRIQKFQNDSSYPVFLLTTQVGGVGITLTAADRVIIYDPSWNPATDAQAVDRVYRIGQDKDVVVYRLITCGSVEEKIYRRQIFKDSITRQATGVADPYRYFSKQELRELFSLENPHCAATQIQLSEMHSSQRRTDDGLEKHITYLHTLNIFGISDHDLMFSRNIQDHAEDNDKAAISENFIKKQVAAAHELIKMEASVVAEGLRLAGTYNRPYQEVLPLPKKSVKDTYKPPVLPEFIDLSENDQISTFLPSEQRTPLKEKMSDENIKTQSLDGKNKGISSDERKHSFPTEKKIEHFFPLYEDRKEEALSATSPKNRSNFSDSKSDEIVEFESSNMNLSSKIEKLQKSVDLLKTIHQDKVMKTSVENIANLSDKDNSLILDELSDDQNIKPQEDFSYSLNEQNVSSKFKSLMLKPDFQEEFKHNLTQLIGDDLKDSTCNEEMSNMYVKSPRKSCARRSTILISDSESSHCSFVEYNSNAGSLADDSGSEVGDFSISASLSNLSIVPDSTTNTPQTAQLPKAYDLAQSVSETPPKSLQFDPESLSRSLSIKSDSSSLLKKHEGSVRRITPLKVDKTMTRQDLPFVHAMATSLILSPYTSPNKNENTPSFTSNLDVSSGESSSDDDDNPIQFIKKKKRIPMFLDSEESDSEQENVTHPTSVPRQETNESYSKVDESSSGLISQDQVSNECNVHSKTFDQACHGDFEHSNGSDENCSDSEHYQSNLVEASSSDESGSIFSQNENDFHSDFELSDY